MKYLIFEPDCRGHRLEYMYHLYMYAGKVMTNDNFVFVLPEYGKKKFSLFDWPAFKNIEFIYLSDKELTDVFRKKLWKRAYMLTKILKKYVVTVKPDNVILDTITMYMPYIPFMIKEKNILSGILYVIPRHSSNRTLIKKILDDLVMRMFAKVPSIKNIWILNDCRSSEFYNSKYNVAKFKWLPDPIYISARSNTYNDESVAKLCKNKVVFLHAGGMGSRKGTFLITEAIKLMSSEERKKCMFIFAGSITDKNSREKMLSFVKENNNDSSIIFTDCFIPYEELLFYFQQADCVLIPYKNAAQSSGILGISAFFKKPVVGPKRGLLGSLINDYHLGLTIDDLNPEKLRETLVQIIDEGFSTEEFAFDTYVKESNIENFSKIILQNN